MRQVKLLAVLVALLGCGRSALGGFLFLDLQDTPDILSGFLDVTYDAGADAFSAQGFALTLDTGGLPDQIGNGAFEITAMIDDSGSALSGALTVGGSVNGSGPGLLSGSLVAFGFDPGGGTLLEFLFEVTGGDLAPAFGGSGAFVGVILDMSDGGYTGDWSLSFDNLIGGIMGTGAGVADLAPLVPAPSVLAIILAGGILPGARRRRRSAGPRS